MSEQSTTTGQQITTIFKVTVYFRKGKIQQVLFLEAREEFVDTLFSFLLQPISTVCHILSQPICTILHNLSQGSIPLEQYLSRTRTQSTLVRENIKFLVTNNLEIIPSNAMTTMIVLKKVGIASVDDLECKAIAIGITQILQLLHLALISNTCLNDVFGLMK